MTKTIHISSRKSDLALVQTNEVKSLLEKKFPNVTFEIGLLDTVGDTVLDKHLSDIGTTVDSGLFTKSLEKELLAKQSRFAVHSLKDMPTTLPQGLILGAICKRESPEDAVILHQKHRQNNIKSLAELPDGSIVGTSSLRREALLRRLYPSLKIKTIRGNIQTRLKKLQDANDFDAIIVAAVGFRRGGLSKEIDELLDPKVFGYGVGQGSIGIECREDDQEIRDMLKTIEDEKSAQCCKAERSLLHHIEGGCQISMGVNTIVEKDVISLSATLLSRDGTNCVQASISGNRFDAEKLGIQLGDNLMSNPKAREILGPRGEKRASTYGNVECPGDAAALAKKAKVT